MTLMQLSADKFHDLRFRFYVLIDVRAAAAGIEANYQGKLVPAK